jgi:hypothetical protein
MAKKQIGFKEAVSFVATSSGAFAPPAEPQKPPRKRINRPI